MTQQPSPQPSERGSETAPPPPRSPAPLLLLLLPLLAASAWVLNHHYHDPVYAKPDWRGVVRQIEQFSLPGDAILLTGDGGEKLFDYYYQGDLPVYHDFNTPVPPPAEAEQRLAEIADRHQRLWYTPYGVDIDAVLENWLAQHTYPAWQSWLGRKRLALYDTSGPQTSAQATPVRTETINAHFTDASGQGPILTGLALPDAPIAAGDLLPLSLTWQTDSRLPADYQLSLRLTNPQGDIFTQSDWPPLTAGRPTSTWPPQQPITDQRSLWIPVDTPPGDYLLQLVVYDPNSGQGLGQPVVIAGIEITPAAITPPPQALSIPNFASRPLGQMHLLGYAAPEKIQPGQEMWLWLYWQARQAPAPDAQVRLTLATAETTVESDFPLVNPHESASAWPPGQVRRAVYHLPTSPRLLGDTASLSVALVDAAGQVEAETPLISLALENRPRNFAAPDIAAPLQAAFGRPPLITLLGYTLTDSQNQPLSSQSFGFAQDRSPLLPRSPAPPLNIILHWQAQAEIETNYTVFLQLLDPAGQVAAQVDQQPLAGAAPTTTWLPGEILTDPYTLPLPPDLPPGEYRLIAGFYDPATGERLDVSEGDNFVELTQVTVQ